MPISHKDRLEQLNIHLAKMSGFVSVLHNVARSDDKITLKAIASIKKTMQDEINAAMYVVKELRRGNHGIY